MGFDGKIMKLDSGAESLFDVKADVVAVGKQKIHPYLPHLHIPDETDDITEKVTFLVTSLIHLKMEKFPD